MFTVNGVFSHVRRINEDGGAAGFSVAANAPGTTVVLKLLPQCPGDQDLGRGMALVAVIRTNGVRGGETGALAAVLPAIPQLVRVGRGNVAEAKDGADGIAQLAETARRKGPLRSAGR